MSQEKFRQSLAGAGRCCCSSFYLLDAAACLAIIKTRRGEGQKQNMSDMKMFQPQNVFKSAEAKGLKGQR